MARRIFVGDIQGCRSELERLLERVAFDPAADELHPVGDFVNRGPDSLGTLRLCRELGAGGVLGNHDLHLLRTADGRRAPKPRDTFQDVLAADDRRELLDWLAARPLVRAWDDALLVHAGLHPGWADPAERLGGDQQAVADADRAFAVSVRWCDAHGDRPTIEHATQPPADARFRPWFEFPRAPGLDGHTMVFGHWSVRGLVELPGLRGLDTGCVWGGALTAWIAEEDRLVSVPAARQYAGHGG